MKYPEICLNRTSFGTNFCVTNRQVFGLYRLSYQSFPILGLSSIFSHYVIKFVSDLRQVSGILWVLLFPPSTRTVRIAGLIPPASL